MLKSKQIALLGILFAAALALSVAETALGAIPFLPPHFKIGLSNVIVMYTLFFIGKKETFVFAVLKSFFVFLTRGPTAGILSFSGGMASVLVIMLLVALFGTKVSYLMLSVTGAIFHNLGQVAAASVLMNTNIILYYLPVLLVSGVAMGSITGATLKAIMPFMARIRR